MPYQGADYVPPGSYSSSRGFPNNGQQAMGGQVPGGNFQNFQDTHGSHNGQAYHRASQPSPQANAYGPTVNHAQTAYSTPQYYNSQGPPQAASFYQAPANLQYPQYAQPPAQTAPLAQQYSPAYYQATPQQPRGSASHSQQYRPQQPQAQRPQAVRPPAQQSVQRNPVFPSGSPSVANAIPQTGNAQFVPQSSPPQRPYQQRAPPTPGHCPKGPPQTPATPATTKPPAQQRAPSTSGQPRPAPIAQNAQQPADKQAARTPSQSQPHQTSPPQTMTIDPSVLLRKAARVEIPVQRSSSIKVEQATDSEMPRSPKRRRSNDGHSLPVCDDQPALKRSVSGVGQPKQPPRSSLAGAELPHSSQVTTPSQSISIDYQTVLLSLSDEYISAAYNITGGLEAAEVSEDQLDEYHALLSTGMGCLDAVLRRYHVADPRKEARIRLRYATLLYEETENDMVAEEVLSKGISVCQRARLQDLQYAMQHLLARIWFKANKPKAAMKAIEKLIIEVEKLNLLHWIYTFRFLRVSLALQKEPTNSETMTVIKNLTTIVDMANRHGHVSVTLVASALEALVHLRSRTPESVDLAQRAMASARTHQLSAEMSSMPQIRLLLDCVDLGCSLTRFNQGQTATKIQAMQASMDGCAQNRSQWAEDGTFLVPLCDLGSPAIELERDTCSILRMHPFGDNICALPFRWLTLNQVYELGFLLSGLAHMQSNSHEQRPEKYLSEGLNVSKLAQNHPPQSLSVASSQYNLNRRIQILLRLFAVFAYTGRADWQSALKGLGKIKEDIKQMGSGPGTYITSLLLYLEAVCRHALGDLDGALELYQSPELKIEGNLDGKSTNVNPICVLAILNSVPIMRIKSGGREPEARLAQIANYCLTHTNNNGNEYGSKALEAALYALKANEPTDPGADNTIIKTKHYLQSAVAAARTMSNNRLLAVVMAMMSVMFFGRIVGDQAEKSAKAGRTLAKKSHDKLWMAVSDGMYGNTLENCGKIGEAESVRREAQEAMAGLPKSLQSVLMASQDNAR